MVQLRRWNARDDTLRRLLQLADTVAMTIDRNELLALPEDEQWALAEELIANVAHRERWRDTPEEELAIVRDRLARLDANPDGVVDWRPLLDSLRSA
jgi:hypothetical protein